MKRRPASLAVIAALVAVVGLNTAARPLPKNDPAPKAKAEKKPVKAVEKVEDAISIDWRVLAGLDYTNGKASDSLKKLEGKLVRIPGFVVPLVDFQEDGA